MAVHSGWVWRESWMSSCSPTRGSRGGASLGTPHILIGRQHIFFFIYIYIPGSARHVLGRKFRPFKPTIGKMVLGVFWNAEATKCWSCALHQRMSEWLLNCQWNDMKDFMHNWLNEPIKLWTNWLMDCIAAMNQWITDHWINERRNQRISASTGNQWINEWLWTNASINEYVIHWINEAMKRYETTNQWTSESTIQRIGESMISWSNEPAKQRINESMNRQINESTNGFGRYINLLSGRFTPLTVG